MSISAAPNSNWTFTGWSGDGDCNDGSVTMSVDRTCTANFQLVQKTLTMVANPAGGGTITPTPGPHIYSYGTVVSISAAPNSNWTFTGWSWDGDCNDGSVTMSVDRTCTANFEVEQKP